MEGGWVRPRAGIVVGRELGKPWWVEAWKVRVEGGSGGSVEKRREWGIEV